MKNAGMGLSDSTSKARKANDKTTNTRKGINGRSNEKSLVAPIPTATLQDGSGGNGMSMRRREAVMTSTVDPPAPAPGGEAERAPLELAGGGTGFPTYTPDQIKEQGMNLWSLVAGHDASIASGEAESIATIQTDGITAAARLKAQSELQAVLRSTSVGLDWESPVCVPAGDLVLVMQMAMQRLG